MKKMFKVERVVILVIILLKTIYSQGIIDNACTVESSGSPGLCKLLTNCQEVRDEVVIHHRLPQTCGFQGTQPIVCCPKTKGPRKPGDISMQKCREYASYAYKNRSSPLLKPEITKNECGHTIVKRIVGGVAATRKEFPHMAILGFESKPGEILWFCGGSIISERYILTAAHCLYNRNLGAAKYVRVGVTNLNDTNQRQELKIAEIILYPEYKHPIKYHDIGLLKLEKPIELNGYARPACLYSKTQISVEKAIATGWGLTEYAGSSSDDLLKVTLTLVDHDFCNMSYKNSISRNLRDGIRDEIQLCAGSGSDGKDTCQGDTGGPIQIYHTGDDIMCMYDILGINSFGKACSGSPSVYTRVSSYIKWIEDIVWPEWT